MTVAVTHTTLSDSSFSATGAAAWDATHTVLGTAGRVLYATTGGVVTDSANLLYDGADLTVYGVRVGIGAGAVYDNTVVGHTALSRNTTGHTSTSIGYQSLFYNTVGYSNTGVGVNSLQSNVDGFSNSGFGVNALFSNQSGTQNTAAGHNALYYCVGNNNTSLGFNSGSSITTGSYNVIIGTYTGATAPVSATGSNYVVLSDGQANVRAYWNGAAATFNGGLTVPQVINSASAVTVSANAGTVAITNRINNFTNSSAAAMTITMATASAVDGQMSVVRIYDFNGVAQTISWVNTENSTVTAAATSNGSTTLPLTVGFMYNSQTSKWRCIASA